jgi:hypothetical protein
MISALQGLVAANVPISYETRNWWDTLLRTGINRSSMVVSPQPTTEQLTPAERVVRVVADEADVDPLDLPPLYSTIDTDALDTVIDTVPTGSVQFRYAGYYVTVEGDGSVEVTDNSDVELAAPEPAADR